MNEWWERGKNLIQSEPDGEPQQTDQACKLNTRMYNPRGGRERNIRDPWLFMQTNWKLSSNKITFDLQQCTSMYVLRRAQEKCWKEKPSPQVFRLFEPHPGLAGCCTYIETQPSQSTHPWCSSHSKLANKHHSVFFTLEVQLTASKGTTTHSQPRLSIRKGAFLR